MGGGILKKNVCSKKDFLEGINGLMRGLEQIMWSQGQWKPQRKKLHPMVQTYINKNKQTDQRTWQLDDWIGPVGRISEKNIARSQNAAQSASHWLLRLQVVLTKRLFKFCRKLSCQNLSFWVLRRPADDHWSVIIPCF